MAGASKSKAALPALTPHETVQKLTDDMMGVIKSGVKTLETNPDQYFSNIRSTLETGVSFSYISRLVMGKYSGLATDVQKEAFQETFTKTLVETFGKGMANYQDLKITTQPFDTSQGDLNALRKVEVVQEIVAPDGKNHVAYTMVKGPEGNWKMINVVLNGVNLGVNFRDQFKQSMKKYDNNIDKVISNWAKPL